MAVRDAAAAIGTTPVGFTARIAWSEVPHFVLAVEGVPRARASDLGAAFDAALRACNLEYDCKRDTDRLGPSRVECLPAGTYVEFRRRRVAAGAPEGQVKDPILAMDESEWRRLGAGAGETP